MAKILVAAALLAAALSTSHAGATAIGFEDVTGGSCASSGLLVSSGGFDFTGNPADPDLFVCNAGVLAQNTTQGLVSANQTSIISLSPTGGGTFSLNSFFAGSRTEDFATNTESSSYGTATGLTIVGTFFGGGTVSTTVTLTGLLFEQFFLPSSFTNLTSVSITALGQPRGVGPEFLIDDIVVNNVFQAAVPEPATWAMMLLGFGAIGFTLRRKRHARLVSATT